MKKLTAKRPILFGGRMYEAGDTLPAQDQRMVNAWLAAGSAELDGHDAPAEALTPPAGADGGQGNEDTQGTENAAEAAENGENGHNMVEGHLDPAQLEEMTKEQLKQLADDMGVDLPRGATKALIVERLAAATVEAPMDNGGGAQ